MEISLEVYFVRPEDLDICLESEPPSRIIEFFPEVPFPYL